MADVDGNGEVNITDVTYIQLYIGKNPKHAKVGEPYTVPRPTQPTTAKPQPTTENPTEPATSGKSLTVTATSNIFPQATTKFDPIANQITVTYWINIKDYSMINAQWTLSYDKKFLTIDETDGVNKKGRKDLLFRATGGNGTVTNYNVESMPDGGVKCNATDLDGYDLTSDDGGRVAFVSVTFNPVEGAVGNTTVNLNVEVLQLGTGEGDQFYFIDNSKIVRSDISYLPSDTATAVYAGVFNESKQQEPDVTSPTTAPVQPTTAAPDPGKSLTVKATSNIFPQATTTFNPISNQITVTYWINIQNASMLNGQWTMSYDKKYLTLDESDGVNKSGKKYQIFRVTNGVGTIYNLSVDSMPDGGIKCNATDLDGYDLTADGGGRIPFVSVTFNPVSGMTGETTVNLDVEYLQLKDDTNPQYYFVDDSKIVRPDISYLPSDTATAVYAGAFDNTKQQKPDDVQPTTQAPEPTEAPTTAAPTTQAPEPTEPPTTAAPTTQAPTQPPTDPPTQPPTVPPVYDMTVNFTNNLNWSTVNVYAWGGSADMQWPGIPMTDEGENGFDPGIHNFSASIPNDVEGIIFNGGGQDTDPQTTNITDFSPEGWYVNSKYTEVNPDGKTVYQALPWGFQPEPSGSSFKFTDNQKWGTVYVHAWNDSEALTTWPGDVMTEKTTNDFGEEVFTIYVPDGAIGVVLSNGNGDQTVDINDFSQEGYYTKGDRDSSGNLYVTAWGPIDTGKKILFTCNWGTCYLYAWNDDGAEPCGGWPGSVITETTTNDFGEKQFVAYIPSGATHIIFNNGNGEQTVNIDNLDVQGYYITGGPSNALTVASW